MDIPEKTYTVRTVADLREALADFPGELPLQGPLVFSARTEREQTQPAEPVGAFKPRVEHEGKAYAYPVVARETVAKGEERVVLSFAGYPRSPDPDWRTDARNAARAVLRRGASSAEDIERAVKVLKELGA